MKWLIEKIMSYPVPNKEFGLFYIPGFEWVAEFCNSNEENDGCVLGEVEGDYRGFGSTPEEALEDLIEELELCDWEDAEEDEEEEEA
jgi:hypothetical protein